MTTLKLKTYQSDALKALTLFLVQAQTMGLEAAWSHAMQRDGGTPGVPYHSDELGEVPVLCLRIPTGGGKTLMSLDSIPTDATEFDLVTALERQVRRAGLTQTETQAYSGRWQFKKHFYPQIAKLKSEGEEFECAKALDREGAVKHWVRNLEQLPEFAFWLPTATDYFYPDFVAELGDGRLLVVEYKGNGYVTNDDSREKRLVGLRWAQTTGHGFVMIEKTLDGMDMAAQIRAAVKSCAAPRP